MGTRGWTRLRSKSPPTTTRCQQGILRILVIIWILVTLRFLAEEVRVQERVLVGTSTTLRLIIVSMNLHGAMTFRNLLKAHLDIVQRLEMALLCLVTIVGTQRTAVAEFSEEKLNIIVPSARLIFV